MRKIFPLLLFLWLGLFTPVLNASGRQENTGQGFNDIVTTSQLGGARRYITYISTDKPLYKTGEPVYIRALALDAATNKPYRGYLEATLQILGPRGELVSDDYIYADDYILSYRWPVPAGTGGGEYTIRILYSEYRYGFPPAERKIEVRAYRPPRLKTEITFLKDGYYPGDRLRAVCEIERAEGGVPEGAEVTISARVDNREIHSSRSPVDEEGTCTADFTLPLTINTGEGTLLFIIRDGGVTETASKTIPLLLDNFELAFYPEGGDLVAGVQNRVYFEARFRSGKPADLEGTIIDQNAGEITAWATEHEGRGSFFFTPQAGMNYFLTLPSRPGKKQSYPLPEVRKQGVVLKALSPVLAKQEPAVFELASSTNRQVKLVISRREASQIEKTLELEAGIPARVLLDLPLKARGVLRATLWEKEKPLAERLIYREPLETVNISLSLEEETYSPGNTVTLNVKTTTLQGDPVGTTVGLRVTDDAVLQLLEKRDAPPHLPAMVFLENEVFDLADANVYLDTRNPRASRQLDLLLGTQGWRRFAFLNWNDFLTNHGDRAKRLGALVKILPVEREKHAFGFFNELDMVKEAPARGGEIKAAPLPPRAMDFDDMEGMEIEDAVVQAEMDDDFQALPAGPDLAGEGLKMDKVQAGEIQWDRKVPAVEEIMEKEEAVLFFREYAHTRRPDWSPEKRLDFTETLYWNAALTTDPKNGKAGVTFDLNDSISSFQVLAEGVTPEGALGTGTLVFDSVKPIYLEPKMPLEVTRGDQITLPVALVNNLDKDISGKLVVKLENKVLKTLPVKISAASRKRELIPLGKLEGSGEQILQILADFDTYTDTVSRSFKLNSPGFPIEHTTGGMVGPGDPLRFQVTIPETMLPGSLRTELIVYPSPVANLTQALKALIRQPYGCFEQTSSTSYPLVMAQQYFLSHQEVDPALVRDAKTNLDQAYKRLTGFESPDKGYEWFGADPGHEALTAYGLMQFTEMQEIMDIDPAMLERTRNWLLSRRNGKGGFMRNPQALDSFGAAPEDTTNAYITWALLESGEHNLEKEIELIEKLAFSTKDSYLVALGANILLRAGKKKEAAGLMDYLQKQQHTEGYIDGAVTSITRSGGESLKIETTALTLLAWLKDPRYAGSTEKAIQYLVSKCQNGMFFSTQGTILALKAIILYDELRARPKAEGSLRIQVDGNAFGDPFPFTKETTGTLNLPDFSRVLTPGKHTITLLMEKGALMPVSGFISYTSRLPASGEKCRLELTTSPAETRLTEGAGTEIKITVTNHSADVASTPLAIIGLPGGLEPRHEQLKEMVKAGLVDAYEVRGQEVIFYWRALKAGETRKFSLSCIAGLPGEYTGPAGRVYEYYTAEYKHWVPGLELTILANQ